MENIVIVEYYDEHWYKIVENGTVYFIPSVTTKLSVVDKPFLGRWRGDLGNREADLRMHEAGQRGKRIHWAWEVALKGGAVVYDPWQHPVYTAEGLADLRRQYNDNVAVLRMQDEMWQVVKLKRQFDVLKPYVLGVEEKMYDTKTLDAGTIDSIYEIKEGHYAVAGAKPLYLAGGIYINDIKSGSVVDDNVWLQLAPYGSMYEKRIGRAIAGALVTHLSAKTKGGIQGLNTLVRERATLLTSDLADYRRASDLWLRNHADDKPHEYQFPSLITLNGGSNASKLP